MIKRIILNLFILTATSFASSLFSVDLKHGVDWKVSWVEANTQEYGFQTIKLQDVDWRSNESGILDLDFINGDVWLKVEIFNTPKSKSELFLVIGELKIDYAAIEIYNQNDNIIKEAGLTLPFETRETGHVKPVFKLPVDKQNLFFLKVITNAKMSFPIEVMTSSEVYQSIVSYKVVRGIFFLIFILLVLYTLIIYFPNKDNVYLYYLGYVILTFMVIFVTHGGLFEFIDIGSGLLYTNLTLILYTTTNIFVLFFAMRLQRVHFFLGNWAYLFHLLIAFYVVEYILILLGLDFHVTRNYVLLLNMIITPLIMITSWIIYRKGFKVALFFFLAWSPMMILVFAYCFYLLIGMQYSFWLLYAPIFIIPVEFIVFNIVIFKKMKFELNIKDYFRIDANQLGSYKKTRLSNLPVDNIISSLKELMQDHKVYKNNPELGLTQLADMLEIRPHQLTELLTQVMGTNFSNFLNKHKVEEAKRLLSTDSEMRIIDIAFESGFQSKSTFNTAFKQFVGVSPSEYAQTAD